MLLSKQQRYARILLHLKTFGQGAAAARKICTFRRINIRFIVSKNIYNLSVNAACVRGPAKLMQIFNSRRYTISRVGISRLFHVCLIRASNDEDN